MLRRRSPANGDSRTAVLRFGRLEIDRDAHVARLGGEPVRVLVGTQAEWAGREALEIPELESRGELDEWLRAPRNSPIRDRRLDRLIYVYPAEASGQRILGETPRFVLVQLDARELNRYG